MPPDQSYPSPTAAQMVSGAGPFFGQSSNDTMQQQIPDGLQQLQQSVDLSRATLHAVSAPLNGNGHYDDDRQLHEVLRVEEAMRQPTSPERLAQSVMNINNEQHSFQNLEASAKSRRSKVSRACDECRRKKIRCDASETGDENCTSCKRTNAPCRFSRQPMKRGPSKGYIKELADRLNTLENQLGPPHGQSAPQSHPEFGSGMGLSAEEFMGQRLGDIHEFAAPPSPPQQQQQQQQQQPQQVVPVQSRKRTHSMSETTWGRDHGYAPAKQAGTTTWAAESPRQSMYPPNPYAPQPTAPEMSQVQNMYRQQVGGWRYNGLEDSRRSDLGMPYEIETREVESGTLAEWDESVVDEYYRLIHQTFPLLAHSKARLRARLAACPATLREAFFVALDCAIRTSPSTHLSAPHDVLQSTKRASELIAASQYENPTARTLSANLIYIQTLILMALESDNHGPATMRGQVGPPRAEWLGRAIGMATHLKLNVPRLRDRFAEGDPDSDEKLGRRVWWILFILDRWHASSTSCLLQLPETSSSLMPEDQILLGESTYHLARLSYILGHLSQILQQPPSLMMPPSPAAPIISTTILGELSRFRESVESLLLGAPNLVHLCYWHVHLLILRLVPTSTPSELVAPAARMANILNSSHTMITPLNHHFAAIAALTLVDAGGFEETRAVAEKGVRDLEEALRGRRGLMCKEGSTGWDSAIRELVLGKGKAISSAAAVAAAAAVAGGGDVVSGVGALAEVERTSAGSLQHLADAAVAGKQQRPQGQMTPIGAGTPGGGGGGAATGPGTPVGVATAAAAEAFDPTLLTRYGYLAALVQE